MRTIFYPLLLVCFFLMTSCDQPTDPKTASPSTANASTSTNNPNISADGEKITIKADNLTQHQILLAMGKQLGFELKFTAALNKTTSINLTNATLREVLQNILSGNPYSIKLDYQSQVDFFPKIVTISPAGKSAPQNIQSQNANSTNPTPATNSDQRIQAIKQFQEKALTNPQSTEPAFLQGMTGTKEDIARLTPILKDPKTSSEDKEAIIDLLQDGEHADVIAPLTAALEDKDPEVVQAAIDAIVFFGEAGDIDSLKKLRDSTKDEDIRQAADDGITFLE